MTDTSQYFMATAWRQMSWAAKKRFAEMEAEEEHARWKAEREKAWTERKAAHPDAFVPKNRDLIGNLPDWWEDGIPDFGGGAP